VFPARADNFDFHEMNASLEQRINTFGGGRTAVYYNQTLQDTRILHFPGEAHHRLVEHFFGNTKNTIFIRHINVATDCHSVRVH